MHKPNILIIDALNLIRRIYAVEEKHTRDPKALIIACKARVHNACARLLKLKRFQYAVAIFDGRNSWRYQYYPKYKFSRAPMPEILKANLQHVASGFELAGIAVYYPENDEADDVIATLSNKVTQVNLDSTIVSTDKGFLPLLTQTVSIYDYFQQCFIEEAQVEKKFSLNTQQLIDFFALVGDKTNDIPGVKGIGKQTALTLLAQHGSVDNAVTAETLESKVAQKLQSGIDDFILSKALLTLRTDIDLGISLRDLRISTSLVAES